MDGMGGMDGMAWWHGGMVAYLHEGKQTLVFGSFRTGQEVFFSYVKDRSALGSTALASDTRCVC